jgi:hypothetical protein
VRETARLPVPGGVVGPLALDEDKLVFPLGDEGGSDWDKVATVDLTTKMQKTVARSEWPHGFINWAAGTGDWVT